MILSLNYLGDRAPNSLQSLLTNYLYYSGHSNQSSLLSLLPSFLYSQVIRMLISSYQTNP